MKTGRTGAGGELLDLAQLLQAARLKLGQQLDDPWINSRESVLRKALSEPAHIEALNDLVERARWCAVWNSRFLELEQDHEQARRLYRTGSKHEREHNQTEAVRLLGLPASGRPRKIPDNAAEIFCALTNDLPRCPSRPGPCGNHGCPGTHHPWLHRAGNEILIEDKYDGIVFHQWLVDRRLEPADAIERMSSEWSVGEDYLIGKLGKIRDASPVDYISPLDRLPPKFASRKR